MKFLKYLLLLILLLVVIFFAKGLLTPTITYESEVEVNKSMEESYAVMSDESILPDWIDGFIRTELVSGTRNTVGAVSRIYVKEGESEMVMEETITSVKVNDHIAMKFTMDFMDMDYKVQLQEKDGKTKISSVSTTSGNGLLAKSIVSFMPKAMKEQEDKNLNKLKTLIEGNTKVYSQEY